MNEIGLQINFLHRRYKDWDVHPNKRLDFA